MNNETNNHSNKPLSISIGYYLSVVGFAAYVFIYFTEISKAGYENNVANVVLVVWLVIVATPVVIDLIKLKRTY